jgi:hypothetical protein
LKKLGQKIFRPKSCVIFSGSEIGRLMGFPIDADVSANGEIILNEGMSLYFDFQKRALLGVNGSCLEILLMYM